MKNKIVIIDTNSSNQFNLLNALNYLGFNAIISKNKKILESDKIIFPGIGSFYHVSKNLKKNLFNFLKNIKAKRLSIYLRWYAVIF